MIVGKNKVRKDKYEVWLESYDMKWNNFVEANSLGDYLDEHGGWDNFVKKDADGQHYGRPRELWTGHFSGNVTPDTEEQFQQFFENATKWIKNRGKYMFYKLKTKF